MIITACLKHYEDSTYPKIVNIIKAIYTNPKFRVDKGEEQSEWKPQLYGIRQGCPLSPYLFMLVMTVMFHDIHREVGPQIKEGLLQGFDLSEILYADDTLLVLTDGDKTNILLQAIERESAYYGLRLNNNKAMLWT